MGNGQFKPGTVTVQGTPEVGQTLTADPGTWGSKLNPTLVLTPSFGYQWYAAGKAIQGATARTFAPSSAHRGTKVHVVVTATLSRYTKATAGSAAVSIG